MKKSCFAVLMILILCVTAQAALSYQKEAEALHQIGLFQGTEQGFELEKAFTRAEGATMLVRLLGKEQEALSSVSKSSFSDVPDWAEPYVGYCFENGITKGTGTDTFSPDDKMTGAEYITLILRSLGYDLANPENVYIAAAENGLMSSTELKAIEKRAVFSRDYMVRVSYCAMSAKGSDGLTLLDRLIQDGKLSEKEAEAAGFTNSEAILDDYL